MARLKYRDRNLAGYCDKPGLGGRSYEPRNPDFLLMGQLRASQSWRTLNGLRRRITAFFGGGVAEHDLILETMKRLFPEAMKRLRGSPDDVLNVLNRILRLLGRIFSGSYRHSYTIAASGCGLLTLSTGPPSLYIDRLVQSICLVSHATDSGNKSLGSCIQNRPRILERLSRRALIISPWQIERYQLIHRPLWLQMSIGT